MQRNKPTILLAATLAFAIGPFLVPDFSGFEPNQYPNPQDEPPIQPATYAFGIWILIYLWLIGSAVFGLLHRRDNPEWEAMRWPMIISLVIGAAWLPVADRSPVWAMVMIFAMLISALVALKRTPVLDPLWTRMPIGLYAGWLTAASFSGLGLLGAGYGVIFDETGWAYTSLQAAMLAAIGGHLLRPEAIFYPLGMVWALIAIAVHNWGEQWGVVVTSLIGALIMMGLACRACRLAEAQRMKVARKRGLPCPATDFIGRSRL